MFVYILVIDSCDCCALLPQALHQSKRNDSGLLVQIFQRKSMGGWCAHSLALIRIELMATLYRCCVRHGTSLLATFE